MAPCHAIATSLDTSTSRSSFPLQRYYAIVDADAAAFLIMPPLLPLFAITPWLDAAGC